MLDVVYVLGTIAFFALMLTYIRACAALGQRAGESAGATTSPAPPTRLGSARTEP